MKFFKYDDPKVELSVLPKYCLLMAYLMIWQRKRNKFINDRNREYKETVVSESSKVSFFVGYSENSCIFHCI